VNYHTLISFRIHRDETGALEHQRAGSIEEQTEAA